MFLVFVPAVFVRVCERHNKNPDSMKIKYSIWGKGTVSDGLSSRKDQILTDSDRVITRSRRHIKGYQTHSGRIIKAPERLIEK